MTKLTVTLGLLVVITAIFAGCKKAETPSEDLKAITKSVLPPGDDDPLPPDFPPLGPDIEALKTYMSSLTNVSISDISYDAASQQFIVFGVEQISLNDLTNSYNDNFINVE